MGRHRIVPIPEVGTLVSGVMAAAFAFVSEVLRHLRLFRKEVALRVVGDLSEDAFRVTALTAQHPFRIGRHVAMITLVHMSENKADTLSTSRHASSLYGERCTAFT